MINYREITDLAAAIREACPDGNDIFFDNTGGPIADAADPLHAAARKDHPVRHGRECLLDTCSFGPASRTGNPDPPPAMVGLHHLRPRQLNSRTAAARLTQFALEGKIVHDEEILPGLEHAPGAIARLYRGENHGKLIIAVD